MEDKDKDNKSLTSSNNSNQEEKKYNYFEEAEANEQKRESLEYEEKEFSENIERKGEQPEKKYYKDGKKSIYEERYDRNKGGSGFNITGLILGLFALLLAFILLFLGYRYMSNGTVTHDAKPATEVMQEKYNPPLKAEKLDPTKVYTLNGSADIFNNVEVSVKQIQFRKDATRLWVHLKNNGGKTVQMIPSANSSLVDNNGHTYKIDSFGGDTITSLPAGANEDIMLAFTPVRSDARQITYVLDGVFDMQNSSWSYNIPVDLP